MYIGYYGYGIPVQLPIYFIEASATFNYFPTDCEWLVPGTWVE